MHRLAYALPIAVLACGNVTKPNNHHDAKPADSSTDAPGSGNDGITSGTRIKLTWAVYPDGARQVQRIHDAMLNIDCNLQTWSDGNPYCVPPAMNMAYTDAGCTQPVGYLYQSNCSQPTSYIEEYAYTSCNNQNEVAHVYHAGSTTGAPTQYWTKSSTGCNGPSTPGTGQTFYTVATEVPVSSLARFTTSAPMGSGPLTLRAVQTADGFSFPLYLHDTANNFDCSPPFGNLTLGATIPCVPANSGFTSLYGDGNCNTAAVQVTSGCTPPSIVQTPAKSGCPTDPPYYYAVGNTTVSSLWQYNSNQLTCTTATPQAGQLYYSVGSLYQLQQMMRITDTTAGRRLERIHDVNGSTSYLEYITLWDTMLNTYCSTTQLPDGTLRCMPVGPGYVQTYFTDNTCATPVDVLQLDRGPASCTAPTVPMYATKYTQVTGQCQSMPAVSQVGTAYTTTLFQGAPGNCQPVNNPTALFYRLGQAVPTLGFSAGQLMTDP